MNKKSRVHPSKLFIAFAILLLVVGIVYTNLNNKQSESSDTSNKVGIQTSWGCLKTNRDVKSFEANEAFLEDVFGYTHIRCS